MKSHLVTVGFFVLDELSGKGPKEHAQDLGPGVSADFVVQT